MRAMMLRSRQMQYRGSINDDFATCRAMGMQSLPVAFGVDTAKWICAASIDITQLSVAAYLYAGLHEDLYAAFCWLWCFLRCEATQRIDLGYL